MGRDGRQDLFSQGFCRSVSIFWPVGIDVTASAPLPQGAESLQEAVVCCRWEIGVFAANDGVTHDAAWFAHAAGALMAADEIVVTRERKGAMVTDDIRPGIAALSAEARPDGTPILVAELNTHPRGLRPAEGEAGRQVGRRRGENAGAGVHLPWNTSDESSTAGTFPWLIQ